MTVVTLPSPDVLVDVACEVGEGPCFDPRTGSFVWVDITRGTLHELVLESGHHQTTTVNTALGAVAPRASHPGFAAATAEGFGFIQDGLLSITDPCLPESELRMNDAKVDARGRLWAGSTEYGFTAGRGRLHRWDGVEASDVQAEGFTLPNGLGWSPEGTTMYLVDSMTHDIFSAAFDVDDGTAGTFAPWAKVESGLPDGLAVDAEGCLWVAVWGAGEVLRFSPTGTLVARVVMPVSQPSSCAISPTGTLYITSARAGLTDQALAIEPHAGAVFTVEIGVPGVPVNSMGA